MKNIILVGLSLLSSVCSAFNDQTAQFPETNFRSVNTYSSCASYQSNITPVGATEVYGSTITQSYAPGKVRRSKEFPEDPMASPIGDTPIALMLGLGVLYVMVMRKKKEK